MRHMDLPLLLHDCCFARFYHINYPFSCILIHHLNPIQLDYLTSEPSISVIKSSLKEIGLNAFK